MTSRVSTNAEHPVTFMKTLGFNIIIHFKNGTTKHFYNVTEIHYKHAPNHTHIAFESDIHSTGSNWPVFDIKEFEATLAFTLEHAYEYVQDFSPFRN